MAIEKRKRDPEATRAAILDAAQKLFLERGYGEVAISEIARAAGVTKSLIHHHFGSKHELWEEVREGLFDAYCELQEEMLEQATEPSAELLWRSLDDYCRFLYEHPELSRVFAWTALQCQDHVRVREKALHNLGAQAIGEAQKAGRLRSDIDPRLVLAVFMAVVEHWALFRERLRLALGLEDREPGELDDQHLDAILKIFMEGVLPR